MLKLIILILVVIFFAANMGGSGIAPSFAVTYCSKILKRKTAILLFGLFVVFGGVLLGTNVTKTLGIGIIPAGFINFDNALIIIFSASLGIFVANILKIPQSTSQSTVLSVVGCGLAIGHINFGKFLLLIPSWMILPVISYLLTFFLHKIIYPPKLKNLWLYEKVLGNEIFIKKISIVSSCYVAFAIGSNNVANAVGPLFAGGIIKDITSGLLVIGSIFIVGAMIVGKNMMCTIGQDVIPLGMVSAAITNFITATLLIFASVMGIPQSLVQLSAASVFAISHNKNGFYQMAFHTTTKKLFIVWIIAPVIAFLSSYLLTGWIK